MNPATPGPLTVLLIPPDGDTALLADEVGGRVPTLTWCYPDLTIGPDIWCKPSQGMRPNEPRVDALMLVNKGAPVAMGCDRVLRVGHAFRDWISPTYTVESALRFARAYADTHPGARVVLLRDGREVES